MKNCKFLLSIGLCVCVMFLTGCFGSKSITPKKFTTVAKKYGYKTLEDLEKAGVEKSQIEMAKSKISASVDKTKVNNVTMVINSDLFDKAKKDTKTVNSLDSLKNMKMSVACLMEFKDDKVVKEFVDSMKNAQGFDSEEAKEFQKKLGIEMKVDEITKGNAKRMILTMKMGDLMTTTTVYSVVGKNLIYVVDMGEKTNDTDKLLTELGF